MKRLFVCAILLLAFPVATVRAADSTNKTAAVMFHGKKLFEVTNISSFSASSRTDMLAERFTKLAKSSLVNTDDFYINDDDELKITAIMSGADIVCAVWESDAAYHGVPRKNLAERWCRIIQESIVQYRKDYTISSYIRGLIFAVVATLILVLIWMLIVKLCRREIKAFEKRFSGQKMLKFVDGDSLVVINHYIVRLTRFAALAWILIIYLNLVLSFFPWTFNLSARLFMWVTTPVVGFWRAFLAQIPSLFTLLVIVVFVRIVLRSLKHVFKQIEEGKVHVRGFYRDWADTTYRLVRLLVIVFSAVAAWPYIPGSSSPAFKGISIFMGVLVSLGSTSAVGNIFGGLMLTYMRAFLPGDFVEINGMKGTVMSRRSFSTRLKTPMHEIITIPNSAVSMNHIINYSQMASNKGVNIGTSITIGYDVPWRKVHELMINSAEGVPDILDDPEPFVLQLSLDDFYVKYKLVVATSTPENNFRILSDLHQNIQDNFAAAGVEIMSPHYQSNREGSESTVPFLNEDQSVSNPDSSIGT